MTEKTSQTNLKQLAQQIAKHVSSFEDIKAFQKQLIQSFIDTALEAEDARASRLCQT